MNIICWNVRGLGQPSKRFLIKDFLNLHFADVCCLQESKLDLVSQAIWREIGGIHLNQFLYLPARGSADGIIIGWNSATVTGHFVSMGDFSLTVDFCSSRDQSRWRCTSVYEPNARNRKLDFWNELRGCATDSAVPWVLCGDFNAIFSLEDKHSGTPSLVDINFSSSFLHDFLLREPSTLGRRFTWTNGQAEPIWVKLDRFLVNIAFANLYTRLFQECLPRLGSDHVPLLLVVGVQRSIPRQFRFELVWFSAEGFLDLVKSWWTDPALEGCGAFILSKKLSHLRGHLRHWAKFSFGSIKLKKLALLNDLEELDIASEIRSLVPTEVSRQRILWKQLEVIRKQEEIYWRQRSRLQWTRDGDENTKFFHAVANGRKNRNFISRLTQDGVTFTDPKDLGNIFVNRFQLSFGSSRVSRLKIDFTKLLELKIPVDLSRLEIPFSLEEITRVVFDLGGDKAPGPDGFPLQFFKNS
ncbi:RNA-directed DNA polymerase protein [Dioscorea alata]|uniref:RNA-directed DNA polymerase protein n=1 Tax=Dioscorea alata TaxID=55571 RepID=A0ACB7VRW9_DIOAL|nr:RNA-directed DNA polymerase protein [Dioscorea alata]